MSALRQTEQAILDLMTKGFRPFLSAHHMAIDLRIHVQTIRRALNRLEKAGLAVRHRPKVVTEDETWSAAPARGPKYAVGDRAQLLSGKTITITNVWSMGETFKYCGPTAPDQPSIQAWESDLIPAPEQVASGREGPITFRSKAHLIDSVLGGLWDYPSKLAAAPVDLVHLWAAGVEEECATPSAQADRGSQGERHTTIMEAVKAEIMRQHPNAFLEADDYDLAIPESGGFVVIDTSSIAESLLPTATLSPGVSPEQVAEAQDAAVMGLLERAQRQIDLGKRTGADGGGHSELNIYVIAEAMFGIIRSLQAERDALRKALEQWDCGSCNDGVYLNRTRAGDEVVTCKVCGGTGQHPVARSALAMKDGSDG